MTNDMWHLPITSDSRKLAFGIEGATSSFPFRAPR